MSTWTTGSLLQLRPEFRRGPRGEAHGDLRQDVEEEEEDVRHGEKTNPGLP